MEIFQRSVLKNTTRTLNFLNGFERPLAEEAGGRFLVLPFSKKR